MSTKLILARTSGGCAALIVNMAVVAQANTTDDIDKLVTTAARKLSDALNVPLTECQVEPPDALDGKWEWEDLLKLLPAETNENRSVEAATAALKAHETALGIEGDEGIQLWHLLVSLLEYSAARGLDFDQVLAEVQESIASGEVQLTARAALANQN